jgi:hypothetical protein
LNQIYIKSCSTEETIAQIHYHLQHSKSAIHKPYTWDS